MSDSRISDEARKAVNDRLINNPAGATQSMQAAALSSQRRRIESREIRDKDEAAASAAAAAAAEEKKSITPSDHGCC